MGFWKKIAAIWQNISLIQRALLAAITLTFIIAGALLTHWARKPDMKMLYQEMAPEEAAKITDKIREKNILYELRSGGTSIYVPNDKVYQLRLDMAKDGLPEGTQGGYKIFDNEKIGVSPFAQNINLKRALQEELAKSIQMIEGVVYTRVHLVNTEQTLFSSGAGQATASVVLRLKSGYRLSASNIAAITHLVASSVEGLKSENVTVIDSQGRLLSGESDKAMASGAGTVQDYRERVEQNLANKVEDMLTAVLGPGRATVKVSAIIDMTSSNLITETYDPTKKVPTKEEIKSNSETEGGSTSAENKQAVPGGVKKDETTVTEYVVGKTVEQKADLPGEIKSLSVAAFVDLSPDVAADANAAKAGGEAKMIMPLSDVEDVIKKALGLKETDTLKVVHAKFHRPIESLVEEKPSNWPRYIAIASQSSLGIMAICALLALKMFSGAGRKTAASGGGELAGAGGAVGLLTAGVENADPLVLRRQIAGTLHNNPDQVRKLFSSWMEEKE